MRFEQIRYLDAAVRAGTLRRAAADVGVAQPSLSQQIQRLEEELNVVLLARSPQGVQPTSACMVLLPHLRAVLHAEDVVYQEANEINGVRKGTVRVGAVGWPTRVLLPGIVNAFRAQYPGVNLVAHEGNTHELRRRIVDGDLDLALLSSWIGTEWASDSLYAVDLLPIVPLDLCVPAGHRLAGRESITTADMVNEAFIDAPTGHLLRGVFEHVSHAAPLSVAYYTDTSATSIVMVSAGIGVSILARYDVINSPYCTSGQVCSIPIIEDWARGALTLVRRAEEQPAPAVRALIKAVQAAVEEFAARAPVGLARRDLPPSADRQ